MSNLKSKQWKAAKYVETEQEDWSSDTITDSSEYLSACGVCLPKLFPTQCGKIRNVGKLRHSRQKMTFIKDVTFHHMKCSSLPVGKGPAPISLVRMLSVERILSSSWILLSHLHRLCTILPFLLYKWTIWSCKLFPCKKWEALLLQFSNVGSIQLLCWMEKKVFYFWIKLINCYLCHLL